MSRIILPDPIVPHLRKLYEYNIASGETQLNIYVEKLRNAYPDDLVLFARMIWRHRDYLNNIYTCLHAPDSIKESFRFLDEWLTLFIESSKNTAIPAQIIRAYPECFACGSLARSDSLCSCNLGMRYCSDKCKTNDDRNHQKYCNLAKTDNDFKYTLFNLQKNTMDVMGYLNKLETLTIPRTGVSQNI
jgi:hypothetical protein